MPRGIGISQIIAIGRGFALLTAIVSVTAPASAQTFFGRLTDDVTVGVDRGSTLVLPEVDATTNYLALDSYGSDAVGPGVLSYGLSVPGALVAGDQIDVSLGLAGPLESGREELLFGGAGYRVVLGETGLSGFVNGTWGRFAPGDELSLMTKAEGRSLSGAAGLQRIFALSATSSVDARVEFQLRHFEGEALGMRVVEEDLRILRFSALHETGVPFGLRTRLAFALAKGLGGAGTTGNDNPRGTIPGASADFLRLAGSAEASVPLSRRAVLNAGVIGQWADVTLPASQRCGYATNAYSRGFDRSYVNGDRCLGSRAELAWYMVLPDPARPAPTVTQAFAGLDGGLLRDVGNSLTPASSDGWSSLSAGVRTLYRNVVAEVTLTHILDLPDGPLEAQDDTRLWFRGAVRF